MYKSVTSQRLILCSWTPDWRLQTHRTMRRSRRRRVLTRGAPHPPQSWERNKRRRGKKKKKKKEQEFWRRDKHTTHYNVITERGSAPRVKSNNGESEDAAAELFTVCSPSYCIVTVFIKLKIRAKNHLWQKKKLKEKVTRQQQLKHGRKSSTKMIQKDKNVRF